MSLKTRASRYPNAEEFLFTMANSVPGCGRATSMDDVEEIVRRFAEYLAGRLAAEDVDSVLEMLDGALRSKRRPGDLPRPDLGKSYQKPDPYFWG